MSIMNRQLNMPALQGIMREFEKQNERMEMTSEVMGDTIDDAFEAEGEQEETDDLVNQARLPACRCAAAPCPAHRAETAAGAGRDWLQPGLAAGGRAYGGRGCRAARGGAHGGCHARGRRRVGRRLAVAPGCAAAWLSARPHTDGRSARPVYRLYAHTHACFVRVRHSFVARLKVESRLHLH